MSITIVSWDNTTYPFVESAVHLVNARNSNLWKEATEVYGRSAGVWKAGHLYVRYDNDWYRTHLIQTSMMTKRDWDYRQNVGEANEMHYEYGTAVVPTTWDGATVKGAKVYRISNTRTSSGVTPAPVDVAGLSRNVVLDNQEPVSETSVWTGAYDTTVSATNPTSGITGIGTLSPGERIRVWFNDNSGELSDESDDWIQLDMTVYLVLMRE